MCVGDCIECTQEIDVQLQVLYQRLTFSLGMCIPVSGCIVFGVCFMNIF